MLIKYDEIFNPIKGHETQLIELFVEFYGEKYREKITRNFNNTEFFFVDTNISKKLATYIDNKKKNEMSDFSLSQQGKLNREFAKRAGFDEQYFFWEIEEISDLLDILTNHTQTDEKYFDAVSFSIKIFPDVLQGKEYNKKDAGLYRYKLIEKLKNSISLYEKEYKQQIDNLENIDIKIEFDDELDDYYKELAISEQSMLDTEVKYDKKIKKACQQYLSNLIGEKISKNSEELASFVDIVTIIFSKNEYWYSLLSDPFIIGIYKQKQYIKLFNKLGFNLGDDYFKYLEVYFNELDEIFSNIKFFGEINLLQELKYSDMIDQSKIIMDSLKRIEKLDLKEGNYFLIKYFINYLLAFTNNYQRNFAYCESYLTNKEELHNICVFPTNLTLDFQTIIHEIGHAIQGSFMGEKGGYYFVRSGLEVQKDTINKKPLNFTTNKMLFATNYNSNLVVQYRNINEVINHYFSSQITNLSLSKHDLYICDVTYHKCNYDYGFPLIRDFVETNKEFVKDSQMLDDPYMLRDFFGKENYDTLDKVLGDCFELGKIAFEQLSCHWELNESSIFAIAHEILDGNKPEWILDETLQYLRKCLEVEPFLKKYSKNKIKPIKYDYGWEDSLQFGKGEDLISFKS